jgi:hypothetical protein
MAPERSPKRVKTNPSEEGATPRKPEDTPLPTTPAPNGTAAAQTKTPQNDLGRSSWYTRTWPRKAAPVTEVTRESISSASNAATEAIEWVKRSTTKQKTTRSPSLVLALGKTNSNSSRALPAEATTSTVHATPEASPRKLSIGQLRLHKSDLEAKESLSASSTEQTKDTKETETSSDITSPPAVTNDQVGGSARHGEQSQASWFPWLSKSSNVAEVSDRPPEVVPKVTGDSAEPTLKPQQEPDNAPNENTGTLKSRKEEQNNKRNWLQMWGSDTPNKSAALPTTGGNDNEPAPGTPAIPIQASKLKVDAGNTATSQASSMETAPPQLPGDGTKSAAWVFWSRAQKNNSSTSSVDQQHVGEIAISDTPSAGRPKRASFSVPSSSDGPNATPSKDTSKPTKAAAHAKSASKSSQAETETSKGIEVSTQDKKAMAASKIESSNATASSKPPAEAQSLRAAAAMVSKTSSMAQLLPPFSDTFAPQRSPTLLEQIGRLLNYSKTAEPKHVNVVKDPPRIKNALAIGVHGYFPAPLIRTVLGQPTGTSIKFADMAAKSIKNYTRSHGYECSVKTAALEGEGKIAERLDLLWKLLLNWLEDIRKVDFILVACHSQGVPVAICLVAKLIDFGCVNSARIGICCMAGVSMGPFLDYKSRWISGSAGELFEFSEPNSTVSTNYIAALQTVLKSGCRVSFVGSIDDQLVSLESSIFSSITHPHIYRAVLIDGRTHAPNFLSHLVGFALKLRNLGVPDHGLIRELSTPLAGSLYTGSGHSMIYEHSAVYDLAVSFALETTELRNIPLTQSKASTTARNPYILPFALRGMLEEEFVKTELHDEAEQLLRQFDDWKPATKVLQDVKFRLEGIRSRL